MMRPEDIPDKLYFKIGEVSKMAEVAPHVLRYWESEFNDINPKRANSKQRLYRRVDVELILTIKSLLHERGFTIAGAKKFLDESQSGGNKTTASKPQLKTIKEELRELQSMLSKKE
ncbi:MAG: MerR family transcriptional regulator [Thermodesulfobacteriota bacterium]